MYPQKPKRKRQQSRKSTIRLLLAGLMLIPAVFFVLRPGIGGSLFADGIALSVMLCAAVYILHQAIIWAIASYLGEDDSVTSEQLYSD